MSGRTLICIIRQLQITSDKAGNAGNSYICYSETLVLWG